MALIRRIDSSGLVKGYVGDGNFDGFLIHARKGLLRLRGPIAEDWGKGKEEKRIVLFSSFFALAECERERRISVLTHLPSAVCLPVGSH